MGHLLLTNIIKHQHIVTVDLHTTKNNVLRKLFIKGTKFRERKTIDFDKAKSRNKQNK